MMRQRTEAIRAMARTLLSQGRVGCVLGYARGTLPLRAQPFFARTVEEADQLVWNSFCGGNLAHLASRWLADNPGSTRLAVVAQGCVSRNLVGLIRENRLHRERLHVMGVPCLGMLDQRKVEGRLPGKVILDAQDAGDELIVRGRDAMGLDFEERILRRDIKRDNCYTCLHRNPVLADETAAEPVEETGGGNIDAVAAPWEKLDSAGRWERFQETFAECIRCYACREVCPLCYCEQCFVDEADPQWCGKTQDPADVQTFHILRAFHCAGRCTDCGACETACPQGIKMRRLTSKLEKDVRALWGYEPGLNAPSVPDKPPLSTCKPDDPQEHFK